MQLETRKEGHVMVVKCLEESLDESIAGNFVQEIAQLIKDGNTLLVLDISAVDFIDSAGLNALISNWKLIRQNGNIVISGAKNIVKNIFQVSRADVVFQMFHTEQDAVKALSTT